MKEKKLQSKETTKRNILKSNSGITLIALVVTIVVLLILAGISINLVLGNNGLISKAREAKNKTEQDQVNTETAMNNLADEIDAILGNGGDGSSDEDVSDETPTTLQIGDYVNYTYDTVEDGYSLLGTQSGYDDDQTVPQSTTTLQWRILNIDEENDTIDLVSATPTTNTVRFKGVLGYNNGVYLLNDMCAELYSNSALGITARSINLADMEKHLTQDGIAARNASTSTPQKVQYGTTKTYTGDYSYYPNLYASQPGAGINLPEGATVTQPTIDGTVPDPYNESAKVYSTPTTETYSQATEGTGLTITQTDYYILINSTNYGGAASVLSSTQSYWLASRCTSPNYSTADSTLTYFADFAMRVMSEITSRQPMFESNLDVYGNGFGFRPVVSFASSLLDGTKDASGAWNLKTAE